MNIATLVPVDRIRVVRKPAPPTEPIAPPRSAADAFMDVLLQAGIDTIYCGPRDSSVDALHHAAGRSGLTRVFLADDCGAVHAAEGNAKATGRASAAIVAAGPGVASAISGLMSAMCDSVPVLCVCGQVNTALLGTDAFGECDALGLTRPVTKWNARIAGSAEVEATTALALGIATSARFGPVVLEFPADVQKGVMRFGPATPAPSKPGRRVKDVGTVSPRQIDRAADAISASQRPLFLVGGGARGGDEKARASLRSLAERSGAAVAVTMSSLGAFPDDHPRYIGVAGLVDYGAFRFALANADLLVVIGSRIDERTIGADLGRRSPAQLVHIDVDPAVINKRFTATLPIVGDWADAVRQIEQKYASQTSSAESPTRWWNDIAPRVDSDRWLIAAKEQDCANHAHLAVMASMRDAIARSGAIVVADGLAFQRAAALALRHSDPRRWVVSAGACSPCFAVPAAIGLAAALPERQVVCVVEEATLAARWYDLVGVSARTSFLRIVVLRSHEMPAAAGTDSGAVQPHLDPVGLVEAVGWTGHRCASIPELGGLLERLSNVAQPCLVQIGRGRPAAASPH